MDQFTFKQLEAAHAPYAISPIPGPKTPNPNSLLTKLLGVRTVPDLGILTTSFGRVADTPIVQRSWGLLGGDAFYGPNFHFTEFMRSSNYFSAVMAHFSLILGSVLIAIPFVRTLAKKFVFKPGEGPSSEDSANDRIEYRGIGVPDTETPTKVRAYCRAKYEGSVYECESPPISLDVVEGMANEYSYGGLGLTGCDFDSERRA